MTKKQNRDEKTLSYKPYKEEGVMNCPVCGNPYNTRLDLKRHLTDVSKETSDSLGLEQMLQQSPEYPYMQQSDPDTMYGHDWTEQQTEDYLNEAYGSGETQMDNLRDSNIWLEYIKRNLSNLGTFGICDAWRDAIDYDSKKPEDEALNQDFCRIVGEIADYAEARGDTDVMLYDPNYVDEAVNEMQKKGLPSAELIGIEDPDVAQANRDAIESHLKSYTELYNTYKDWKTSRLDIVKQMADNKAKGLDKDIDETIAEMKQWVDYYQSLLDWIDDYFSKQTEKMKEGLREEDYVEDTRCGSCNKSFDEVGRSPENKYMCPSCVEEAKNLSRCAICGESTWGEPAHKIRPYNTSAIERYGLKADDLVHLSCLDSGTVKELRSQNIVFVDDEELRQPFSQYSPKTQESLKEEDGYGRYDIRLTMREEENQKLNKEGDSNISSMSSNPEPLGYPPSEHGYGDPTADKIHKTLEEILVEDPLLAEGGNKHYVTSLGTLMQETLRQKGIENTSYVNDVRKLYSFLVEKFGDALTTNVSQVSKVEDNCSCGRPLDYETDEFGQWMTPTCSGCNLTYDMCLCGDLPDEDEVGLERDEEAESVPFSCNECGHKFKKTLGPRSSYDVECPKCHGVDVEPEFTGYEHMREEVRRPNEPNTGRIAWHKKLEELVSELHKIFDEVSKISADATDIQGLSYDHFKKLHDIITDVGDMLSNENLSDDEMSLAFDVIGFANSLMRTFEQVDMWPEKPTVSPEFKPNTLAFPERKPEPTGVGPPNIKMEASATPENEAGASPIFGWTGVPAPKGAPTPIQVTRNIVETTMPTKFDNVEVDWYEDVLDNIELIKTEFEEWMIERGFNREDIREEWLHSNRPAVDYPTK